MPDLVTTCQCRNLGPDLACTAQMTAEDLLCDYCRRGTAPEPGKVYGCMSVFGSGPHFQVELPEEFFRGFLPRGS